jgi:Protein of unknown function (DUF721).
MHNNSNERTLSDLIKEFYEINKGPNYLDEQKIINSWKSIMGAFIASHTTDLNIKNGILFARIDSDSLRSELSFSKSLLIKNLNQVVGKDIVKEVVFK